MLTCSTDRDWSDGLSKVVRRSAVEAAVQASRGQFREGMKSEDPSLQSGIRSFLVQEYTDLIFDFDLI